MVAIFETHYYVNVNVYHTFYVC